LVAPIICEFFGPIHGDAMKPRFSRGSLFSAWIVRRAQLTLPHRTWQWARGPFPLSRPSSIRAESFGADANGPAPRGGGGRCSRRVKGPGLRASALLHQRRLAARPIAAGLAICGSFGWPGDAGDTWKSVRVLRPVARRINPSGFLSRKEEKEQPVPPVDRQGGSQGAALEQPIGEKPSAGKR